MEFQIDNIKTMKICNALYYFILIINLLKFQKSNSNYANL